MEENTTMLKLIGNSSVSTVKVKGEEEMQRLKKKLVAVLIVTTFLMSIIPISIIPTRGALPSYEPMRLGPEFMNKQLPIDGFPTSYGSGNPTKTWLSLDDWNGYYFFTEFELMAEGDLFEVWVQIDPSYPVGDPRATPVITQAEVDYLLYELENNIYPVDTTYFGVPDYHDGSLSLLEAWGYVPPGYYYQAVMEQTFKVFFLRKRVE